MDEPSMLALILTLGTFLYALHTWLKITRESRLVDMLTVITKESARVLRTEMLRDQLHKEDLLRRVKNDDDDGRPNQEGTL